MKMDGLDLEGGSVWLWLRIEMIGRGGGVVDLPRRETFP